jgi:hypothetical protein
MIRQKKEEISSRKNEGQFLFTDAGFPLIGTFAGRLRQEAIQSLREELRDYEERGIPTSI